MGCCFVPFTTPDEIHNVDLIWDPGLGASRMPRVELFKIGVPVVVTCHGAGPFVLAIQENWYSVKIFLKQFIKKIIVRIMWFYLRRKIARVIAVSVFGEQEVSRVFNIPSDKMSSVHHGVNHDVFCEVGEKILNSGNPFFLSVAQYQPVKNIDRVIAAYRRLPEATRPDLYLILPGYTGVAFMIPGLHVITEKKSATELACWYRGAIGFVFPSLRESFGMPILEAMACGCPVITSNDSACAEVAGDAAILVSPRNEDELYRAMHKLAYSTELQNEFRKRGKNRASEFSWKICATLHLKEFRCVIDSNNH